MYRSTAISTVIFLILLRLAIGWHFLFEGVNKLQTTFAGETTTSRPFSSGGFFREANGPLGPVFRSAIGDPDREALSLLTVQPRQEGDDPAGDKPQARMPRGLNQQWMSWVEAFEKHYGLDAKQRNEVTVKFQQQAARVVTWLEDETVGPTTKEIKKSYPTGDVTLKLSTAERIREYRAKLDEIRDMLAGKNWAFGKDVSGANLRKAKAEAAELRTGLLKDIDQYTTDLKTSVETVLTPEQKEMGPVSAPEPIRTLYWIDLVTRYGLTAMGLCLMVGFLTRTNCWLAAGFLLTTYLCTPAFPWLPAAPQSEGNYVFVNKNLIEMLALCVLATTASDTGSGWTA